MKQTWFKVEIGLSKERGRSSGGESGDQSVDGKSQATAHGCRLKSARRSFKVGLLARSLIHLEARADYGGDLLLV